MFDPRASHRAPPRRRRRAAVRLFVALVLLLVGSLLPAGVPAASARPPTPGGSLPTVTDGGNVSATLPGGGVGLLNDSTSDGAANLSTRSYFIHLTTDQPSPGFPLHVLSHPVADWAFADQYPWGADNLPPLPDWTWSVWSADRNVTANWTITPWNGTIEGTVEWVNATYRVVGTSAPHPTVQVGAVAAAGATPPGVGFVLNDPNASGSFPTNDSDYTALAAAPKPALLRFGLASAGTDASWNPAGYPKFNFTGFDATLRLAAAVHAPVLLSLPVGTWGDGNLLPNGMPLDTDLPVAHAGQTGYFPTGPAYAAYVGAVVNHTLAAGLPIAYWSVGNEMPLTNTSVVDGYIALFNIAARVVHAADPSALVGSDVMMNRTYLARFAGSAEGVGFLSFHFYPAAGLCIANGTYCPPTKGAGTPTPSLFQPTADLSQRSFYPPHLAQILWHNATGTWLPVFDAESNLNGIGGSIGTANLGTDPRQQSLVGAVWTVWTLLRGAQENLSAVTYFTLTGTLPDLPTLTSTIGGWGFGASTEGAQDRDVLFAPYWALELWGAGLVPGGPGRTTTSSDPSVAAGLATGNASHRAVLLVNLVQSPVTTSVDLGAGGPFNVTDVRVLDGRSYVENYHAAERAVSLDRSGVLDLGPGGLARTVNVTIDGYGVALILADRPANGSARGSSGSGGGPGGNTSGPGNDSSSGNGTAGPSGPTGGSGAGASNPPRARSVPPTGTGGRSPSFGASLGALWSAHGPSTAALSSVGIVGLGTLVAWADLRLVRPRGRGPGRGRR